MAGGPGSGVGGGTSGKGGGGGGGGSWVWQPAPEKEHIIVGPKGGCKGKKGGPAQGDDWTCPECGINNWARRPYCFKCKKARDGPGYAGDDGTYGAARPPQVAPAEGYPWQAATWKGKGGPRGGGGGDGFGAANIIDGRNGEASGEALNVHDDDAIGLAGFLAIGVGGCEEAVEDGHQCETEADGEYGEQAADGVSANVSPNIFKSVHQGATF